MRYLKKIFFTIFSSEKILLKATAQRDTIFRGILHVKVTHVNALTQVRSLSLKRVWPLQARVLSAYTGRRENFYKGHFLVWTRVFVASFLFQFLLSQHFSFSIRGKNPENLYSKLFSISIEMGYDFGFEHCMLKQIFFYFPWMSRWKFHEIEKENSEAVTLWKNCFIEIFKRLWWKLK